MKRSLYFIYGVLCYFLGLAPLFYMMGFLSGFLVPKTIDSGVEGPLFVAVTINLLLMILFGVQHSVMARQGFKKAISRIVPKELERSTFVLISGAVLAAVQLFWQPITTVLWDVSGSLGGIVLTVMFFAGWGILLGSSFLINHFDLFGLRQVYLQWKKQPYTHVSMKSPLFYRIVRHPLYFGLLVAFWATPVMTTGHLLFAVIMTAYVRIGIYFEEKDLLAQHGISYQEYRQTTPMLIPLSKRKKAISPEPLANVSAID